MDKRNQTPILKKAQPHHAIHSSRKNLFVLHIFSPQESCSSYLVTSYCLVDVSLSLVELSKEFVCFGIPLLDFEILWYMSRRIKQIVMRGYCEYNFCGEAITFSQPQGSSCAYLFASSYSFASKYSFANKNPLTGFCGKKTSILKISEFILVWTGCYHYYRWQLIDTSYFAQDKKNST